ncbi:MAG: helix-turn-helix domain-containing protein [Nanoarchaeota archaeon]
MSLNLHLYGLNKYESDAYTALVQEGLSTALEVSRNSGVPHGKIYPTLDSLECKGFVKKYLGTPKRFMAIPPKVALEEATRKKEIELEEFKAKSASILTKLGTLTGKKASEPLDNIKIIEGYKNYLNLSVELHKKTKKEWRSISELSTYKPHIDVYKESVQRGIKVYILTSKEEATKEKIMIWKKSGAKLRYIDLLPTKFSIKDESDVTLRFGGQGKYVSLWVQNQSLAKSMKNYFNSLWKSAKEV